MARDFEDHCWQDVVTADMLAIYSAYQRETRVGERPALVLVDLYRSAFEGGPRPVLELQAEYPASCGEHAWNAVAPTLALIEACRARGVPVIHATADVREGSPFVTTRPAQRRRIRVDPRAFEFQDEFTPLSGEPVVYKQRASAFFGTPLAVHLTRLGARSVIVAGETTSGCVRATAVDAYSHGFHVVLAEECCFDRSPLPHKMNLFDLHHKYADVMHLDDVLSGLGVPPAYAPAVSGARGDQPPASSPGAREST